jgi:alpha-D-ribose 1-methylphosphonate 5-triphosphate synthase subunit PhnG
MGVSGCIVQLSGTRGRWGFSYTMGEDRIARLGCLLQCHDYISEENKTKWYVSLFFHPNVSLDVVGG